MPPPLAQTEPRSERVAEFLFADAGLLEHAAQGALVDFAVHGHDTSLAFAPENGVASLLPEKNKPKFPKGFDRLRAGHARQLTAFLDDNR